MEKELVKSTNNYSTSIKNALKKELSVENVKVLMIVRPTFYSSPGGDTVQVEMTAKELRDLDVIVDIKKTDEYINYPIYDLIHFFNIIRPDDILPHIKHQIPFVVSTIFVDYSEYEKKVTKGVKKYIFKLLSSGQIEYIKAIARWIVNGYKIKSPYYLIRGHKKSIKLILSKSKMLLPNSNSEYLRLKKYIKISTPFKKIVNAVDVSLFGTDHNPDKKFSNHVLCVGRIEKRKNQLNLIKAVLGTEIKLTIIGHSAQNQVSYFNECKALASEAKNIQILGHMSHDKLLSIYKAAYVHVLPSWSETTGLSSLEAAAMDCNIVISKKGDTEEYFGDFAFYCEPDDVASIRDAITKALNSPVKRELKKLILEKYTWENTALQTLEAYTEVLAPKI